MDTVPLEKSVATRGTFVGKVLGCDDGATLEDGFNDGLLLG